MPTAQIQAEWLEALAQAKTFSQEKYFLSV